MALTPTYQLKTFADLFTAVREELKIQSTDTTAINRIKRDINIVYLEEVVPFAQWKWLRGVFDATVYAAISNGTAYATQGSNTITLSASISSPKNGWLFGIVGYSEVYRIANHTANSAVLTLQAPYTGVTNLTGQYKIWTDEIYIPSFVRETFELTHDFQDQPLENCGLQKFRSYVASLPRAEGRPYFYTTNTYIDPIQYAAPIGIPAISTRSSNAITKTLTFASDASNYLQQGDRIRVISASDPTYNGEFVIATQSGTVITYTAMVGTFENTTTETTAVVQRLQPSSDTRRAKRILVYPAIFNQNTTLHIDYIREVVGLADDTDEPLMPIGDRTIILYGALNRAWSRERNPEEAKRNLELFSAKLIRMAGKMDDSIDQPILRPNKIYLGSKRMAQRQKDTRNGLPEGWGGGNTGGQVVTGTANRAAQFDSTGTLAAATVTSTELARLSGILSKADGISDTNTLTNKTLLDTTTTFANTIDGTKTLQLSLTGQTTSTKLTLASIITVSRTITFPDVTDTLVTLNATQTLTNKSIDGSANTITNITNGAISSTAAISFSKLAPLATGQVIVGNASTAIAVTLGGDATISNAGVLTIASSAITLSKMASGAAVSGQVITADGSGGQSYSTPASSPDSSFFVTNGSIAASVASSAVTIFIKDKIGNDPSASSKVSIGFRNINSSTGNYSYLTVSSGTSITIPSGTGLGAYGGYTNYLFLYAINNSGNSIQAGISTTNLWDEAQVQNIAPVSGGSSANAIYASSGYSNVPIRQLGRIAIIASTGTSSTDIRWVTAPAEVSPLPLWTRRQYVVGAAQTSDAATASTSYVTPANAPTVTLVAERTGLYKIWGVFPTSNSIVTDQVAMRIIATTGNPTVIFSQTSFCQTTAGADMTSSPYTIVQLVAGTTYTFSTQMKTNAGTATLTNSATDNGCAIIAEEL